MTDLSNTPTYSLVQAGIRHMQREHDEKEQQKLGVLRGGNTGILTADGRILGKCARQTYLRLIGVDCDQEDASREFMFAAGRTNEDSWMDLLIRSGISASSIRREEEVPISWTTKSGRLVTGRPDIVIGEGEGAAWVPKKGIELKLASSLWTARDVAVKGEPKAMHLMQAAHYAWQLNVPFELWYAGRADFEISYANFFPKQGEPGSEFIQYNDQGKARKIRPFIAGYELAWANGSLIYRRLGPAADGQWKGTPITQQGIRDYYELVDSMVLTGVMPPRPQNVTASGEKGGYSICDYCPIKAVCDKREKGPLDVWVKEAKAWTAGLPAMGSFLLDSK